MHGVDDAFQFSIQNFLVLLMVSVLVITELTMIHLANLKGIYSHGVVMLTMLLSIGQMLKFCLI